MSRNSVLITEQYGPLGARYVFKKNDQKTITRHSLSSNRITTSIYQTILNVFRAILLPHGYPDSVSKDYYNYQFWDTIQAFCSTITGIFTTQAILKGVGVGDGSASALSATVTWIIKDGTGMMGRIVFAWWKGNGLDCNCKKWRLFADFLNDLAMLFELFLPYFSNYSTIILCLSTIMKSIVGVAGGATRASITNHQAIRNNTAEIAAKDGSQETLVNLLASFLGLYLINSINDLYTQWSLIVFLIILHLYANYRAVTALIFRNINENRMALIVKDYLIMNAVHNPDRINLNESVILGRGLNIRRICGFNIVLGQSLKHLTALYNSDDFDSLSTIYKNRKYLIIVNIQRRKLYVSFEKNETSRDVIAAYFHAILLGITTCLYNNFKLNIGIKRQLHHSTPLTRLDSLIKSLPSNTGNSKNLPINFLLTFDEFIEQEIEMFFTALQMCEWQIDDHSLQIDEWRINWKDIKVE